MPFDATKGDRIFATDAAPFNDTPACSFQGGVDMFGSGFGFVHGDYPVISKILPQSVSSPNAFIGDMVFQAVTNQIPDNTLGNDRNLDFYKRLIFILAAP